jgi:hypothetical protein
MEESMEHDIERFGFTSVEVGIIVQAYNGIKDEGAPDSERDDLLVSVQENMGGGLDAVEEALDGGHVAGDPDRNREQMADWREGYRVLQDKIAGLTEDQAHEVRAHAIGFWERQRAA